MSKDSEYWLQDNVGGWHKVPKEIFEKEKKAKQAEERKEKVAWKITEAVGIYTPLAIISACFWPVGAVLGAGYLAFKGINAISDSQKEKAAEIQEEEDDDEYGEDDEPAFQVPVKRYRNTKTSHEEVDLKKVLYAILTMIGIFGMIVLSCLFIIWFYGPNGPFFRMISH